MSRRESVRGAQGAPVLKRLRRKVIAIIMVLTGFVLIASNVLSTFMLTSDLDSVIREGLTFAAEKGPEAMSMPVGSPRDEPGDLDRDAKLSLATFCMSVGRDGTVTASSGDRFALQGDTLAEALELVLAADKDYGRLDDMGIMYARVDTPTGCNIALLDLSSFEAVVQGAVWSLIPRILLSLGVMFVIAVVFARYVTAPVARVWQQQRRFIADASHELKTPLTVMLASADIMAQHPERTVGDNEKWLSSITEEGTRMRALIENLVAAARAAEESDNPGTTGKRERTSVDVSELVQRSALQFEAVAFDRSIDFSWSVADGLSAMGSADELERLTRILLDNAMKYAAPTDASGGKTVVELSCSKPKGRGRIELSVRNSGEAIPAEKIAHLFDRFYRADESRTGEGSFGLGLFIAQSIAQGHGGTISVTSTPENGTTFVATIPATSGIARRRASSKHRTPNERE